MKYIKLFENFADGDNKYPSSITVKPTDEFERRLKDIKNSEGKPSFFIPKSNPFPLGSEFTLKRNGDRFNLVKVATTPYERTKNELDGKSFVGKQDDHWLSYDPKNSEIYVHTSRIFGTDFKTLHLTNLQKSLVQDIQDFKDRNEITNIDRRYSTTPNASGLAIRKDYRDVGLIWIGGYHCKFEKGFEVGMKDHLGYFEITKVEI